MDVYADLARDVTRRAKLRNALHLTAQDSGEEEENDAGDDEDETGPWEEVVNDASTAPTLLQPVFPQRLGKIANLATFQLAVPADVDAPFRNPLLFKDRLGTFLADGTVLSAGTFPTTDDAQITTFPVCKLQDLTTNTSFRVHARANHYRRAKYSFVEIRAVNDDGDEEMWIARVWLLFRCVYRGVVYKLAAISYLQDVSSVPYNTTKRTLTWFSTHVDCVEVAHITRSLTLVPSCVTRPDQNAYHLLH